jgi:hypothetical protein
MSFLTRLLDVFTWKQSGENGNEEYTWSNDNNEKFSQFYFQLVRDADHDELEEILNSLLYDESQLCNLFKLIGHTRDIKYGKGECELAYLQIYTWYQHHPNLAKEAFRYFVNDFGNHQIGSWKDVKYLCRYILNRAQRKYQSQNDKKIGYQDLTANDKRLIDYSIKLLVQQLRLDYKLMKQNKPISLAAKWCPREKSSFGWLYPLIVREWNPEYFNDNTNKGFHPLKTLGDTKGHISFKKSQKKAKMLFRKILSSLNKYIDTTQIKMCGKEWRNIDFHNVTSMTMERNKKAFLNVSNNNILKSKDIDRMTCRKNFLDFIKNTDNLNGLNNSIYKFVKDAVDCNKEGNNEIKEIINKQWENHKKQNKTLTKIIPMADVSGSMTVNNCFPLYNSIGLSIRVAELNEEPFKNRVLTFSAKPSWIQFQESDTFVDKVKKFHLSDYGLNTNFYKALKMILDVIIENDIEPQEVEDMTLAIFSDMQIDCATNENQYQNHNQDNETQFHQTQFQKDFSTMYEKIKEMYKQAGLNSKFSKPYNPPHILFWNLNGANGFPVLSNQPNVTMFSGYSPILLNYFNEKTQEELKKISSFEMINDILKDNRYDILENIYRVIKD